MNFETNVITLMNFKTEATTTTTPKKFETKVTTLTRSEVCGKFVTKEHAILHKKEWINKTSQAVGYLEGMGLRWNGEFWLGDEEGLFTGTAGSL